MQLAGPQREACAAFWLFLALLPAWSGQASARWDGDSGGGAENDAGDSRGDAGGGPGGIGAGVGMGLDISGLQNSLKEGGVDGLNRMLQAFQAMGSSHRNAANIKKDADGNEFYDFRNVGKDPVEPTPGSTDPVEPTPGSNSSKQATPQESLRDRSQSDARGLSEHNAMLGHGAATAGPKRPRRGPVMPPGDEHAHHLGAPTAPAATNIAANAEAKAVGGQAAGPVTAAVAVIDGAPAMQILSRLEALEKENSKLHDQLQMQAGQLEAVEAAQREQERVLGRVLEENDRLRDELIAAHQQEALLSQAKESGQTGSIRGGQRPMKTVFHSKNKTAEH